VNKITIVVAILCFIGIIVLLLLPRKELTEQDKVKQWKPRDFYYIYQMWTDKDLIELKEKIEHDEMVRNKKVG
jgi:preprotein translocase subunit SecG